MNNDYNEKFNKVLMDLLRTMYMAYGTSDMSTTFEVTISLDKDQRIVAFNNMKVAGQLKAPANDLGNLTEKLNNISKELLTLPETYRLKDCFFSVQHGGEMVIEPTYINNTCIHVWLGNSLWDGKTPEGNRTGGILFTCKSCGATAYGQEEVKRLGGSIDWENSKIKPTLHSS